MSFYQISTMAGTFWIQAPRASDAYRLAYRILGLDAEFVLSRETDLTWVNEAQAQ